MLISELAAFQDREVVLKLNDGEMLRAKILFVDSEYEDIVIDVIASDNAARYKDQGAAYTVPLSEIVEVCSPSEFS